MVKYKISGIGYEAFSNVVLDRDMRSGEVHINNKLYIFKNGKVKEIDPGTKKIIGTRKSIEGVIGEKGDWEIRVE